MEANKNLAENLIKLRKNKGLLVSDVANVLNVEVEQYKKYEYGMEMPSLDFLEKINKFYNVDPADLFIAECANGQQNMMCVKAVKSRYKTTKIFNIILLVLAGLAIISMFLPICTSSYYLTVTIRFCTYLASSNALYVIIAILWLLIAIWDIIDNTLLLCKLNGKYALTSKILRMITGCLVVVLMSPIVIDVVNILTYDSSSYIGFGLIILALIAIAQCTLKIIAFCKTKEITQQTCEQKQGVAGNEIDTQVNETQTTASIKTIKTKYTTTKVFDIILLCLAGLLFIVMFLDASSPIWIASVNGSMLIPILCLIVVIWDVIDNILLLCKFNGKYSLTSKILRMVTGCLMMIIAILFIFASISSPSSMSIGGIALISIAIAQCILKIIAFCKTKKVSE